jgi:TolB-like protein/Tfp pilus assembly protein PilF
VAGAYIVTSWAISKTAELMLEKFSAPEWALQSVLVTLLVTFPVVVALTWIHGLPVIHLDLEDGDGGIDQASVNAAGIESFDMPEVSDQGGESASAASTTGSAMQRLSWIVPLIALAVFAGWRYLESGTQTVQIHRLAVLPPENLTGDPDSDYFVMGMHDALISRLGETLGEQADVIGRRSVQRYTNSDLSVPEIARELEVDALVESVVLRSGDGAVINARLTQAHPERQIWTGNYQRSLQDIGALYSDVARAIAGEISSVVLQEGDQAAVNPAAYDAFLLGKHYRNRLTDVEGDLMQAVESFREASALDPDFAQAYAGQAEAWSTLGWANVLSPDRAWPRMEIAAEQAMALDPQDPDVRVASALLNQNYRWNWEQAEADYSAALAANPNHIEALLHKAQLMSVLGRYEEAIELSRRAVTLEPGDPYVEVQVVWALTYAGRLDEAEQMLDQILETHPTFGFARWFRTNIYTRQGRFEDGIRAMEEAIADLEEDDLADEYALIGYLHGRLGRQEIARDYLEKIRQQSKRGRYVSPILESFVHLGLDERDEAIDLIAEGVKSKAGWVPLLPLYADWYQPVRTDPRFQALMDQVGLPY